MKRIMIPVLAAAFMLSGCGQTKAEPAREGNTPETVTETTTTTMTETVTSAPEKKSFTAAEIFDMLSNSGLGGSMDSAALYGSGDFTAVCEKLYGIPADQLIDGGIMYDGSGQSADEVSVLKGGEGLSDLLKQRAASRADTFEGYAPEEQKKAEEALVFECGEFSVLVISDNAGEIKKKIISM